MKEPCAHVIGDHVGRRHLHHGKLSDVGPHAVQNDRVAPHWHGNTVILNGMRTDVAQLSMMQMATADMIPDDVGTWLFHCHVSFHNEEGMAVRYRVTP